MSRLCFRLRAVPPERLDLSAVVPERLDGLSTAEIEKLPIGTTKSGVRVADIFAVSGDEADDIVFEGGSERFDFVGHHLRQGRIRVDGSVGFALGRLMRGGIVAVSGSAGLLAGSCMHGGRLIVDGSVGDFAGAGAPGDSQGMSGGFFVVRGAAGDRLGDRMRRGIIIVAEAGRRAGSRMIGGTIVAKSKLGDEPGILMRRGTVIAPKFGDVLPTFVDCGIHDLTFLQLLGRRLATEGVLDTHGAFGRVRRYAGDMATLGKGELFELHIR